MAADVVSRRSWAVVLFFFACSIFTSCMLSGWQDGPSGPLTPDELRAWRTDGYIFLPGGSQRLFATNVQRELFEEMARLGSPAEASSCGRQWNYFESADGNDNQQLFRVERFVPFVSRLLQDALTDPSSSAMQAVGQLLRRLPILWKDKINFKRPNGQAFEPHQDAQARWHVYNQTQHVSLVVALDRATKHHGTLEVAPHASERRELLGPYGARLPADVEAALPWVTLEMQPGDVVFLGSYTPHRSGPNLTNKQRRLMLLSYAAAAEGDWYDQYFQDKQKTLPPDCNRLAGREYKYEI